MHDRITVDTVVSKSRLEHRSWCAKHSNCLSWV